MEYVIKQTNFVQETKSSFRQRDLQTVPPSSPCIPQNVEGFAAGHIFFKNVRDFPVAQVA